MEINEIPGYVVDQARKKGADDVICSAHDGERKQVKFTNSEVAITKTWEATGVDVFLAKDRKIMYTSVNDLHTLDKTIDDMLSFVKMMAENKNYQGIANGPFNYRNNGYDKRISDLEGELVELAGQAIDSAMRNGGDRVAGVLYSSSGTLHLATSGGVVARHTGSDMDISLRAFASKEASGHSVQSVSDMDNLDPQRIGLEAGMMAKEALNPSLGKTGKVDVLFTPLAFANFLERAAGSASAGNVDAGMSFFKDQIGEKVGPEFLTMTDDGTDPKMVVSPPFDSEGVPTQKNVIIENGVLKTYLHNTSTAKLNDTVSTGNAGLIFPRAWNCAITPGTMSKDDMISDIKDGLYITNLWYTRFQNYQTGDFSTIPRDAVFEIKDGKITDAVKDIRISENMLGMLDRIKHIGNDPEQIRWWEVGLPIRTPHVVVEGVNITKSTQ